MRVRQGECKGLFDQIFWKELRCLSARHIWWKVDFNCLGFWELQWICRWMYNGLVGRVSLSIITGLNARDEHDLIVFSCNRKSEPRQYGERLRERKERDTKTHVAALQISLQMALLDRPRSTNHRIKLCLWWCTIFDRPPSQVCIIPRRRWTRRDKLWAPVTVAVCWIVTWCSKDFVQVN